MPLTTHRHPRLRDNDYTRGAYFVTLCALDRRQWFGQIVGHGENAQMEPSDLGRVVLGQWHALPLHFAHLRLDQVQLMPDHLHAIVVLSGSGSGRASVSGSTQRVDATVVAADAAPNRPNGPPSGSLGAIIGAFKSATTYGMNQLRNTPGQRYWQRGFHDRAIRTTHSGEFERIAKYIADNPKNWL
ncbi:MAG: hypothetical protein WAT74_11975 [Flavobacteriales bacterium]